MMKIYSTHQVKQIDDYTIKHEPIRSIDLMERAAEALFFRCIKIIPPTSPVAVYCGPGNNGGDGLAVARMLLLSGFHVQVYFIDSKSSSPDFEVNLSRLKALGLCFPVQIAYEHQLVTHNKNTYIVDALFGSGLSRPLDGIAKYVVNHINQQKKRVIAIDIPSGLFGDDNPYPNPNSVVKADVTLTLQFPKMSFFFAENQRFVGSIDVVPIGLHQLALENTPSSYFMVEQRDVAVMLPPRQKFSHKGSFGHALVIAGKVGMMGAASFAISGCIKAGAGLVTAHIPRSGLQIVQTAIPESIVSLSNADLEIDTIPDVSRYSAVCVGPGIGISALTLNMLESLISSAHSLPLVIDADALNLIAANVNLLSGLRNGAILTPHPGEFDRLFGRSSCGEDRLSKGVRYARELGVTIVIKGANTQVVSPLGEVFFIPVGNAGMATGGSGDVLSGIITSLLAQGLEPTKAAIAGAYVHGVSGDIAAAIKGQLSLSATDIVSCIPSAFKQIATI